MTSKEQLISALQNLESNMLTCAELLKLYGVKDHSDELKRASTMVADWIDGVKNDK